MINLKSIALILILIYVLAGCADKGESTKNKFIQSETKTQVVEVKGQKQIEVRGIDRGKVIYEKYCFYCHGREGRGDGVIGIAIIPHPVDFVNDTGVMVKSDEKLFKSISEGVHRDEGGGAMRMPRWKDILTDQDRWDVLAYIRYLSKKGAEKER